MTTLKLFGVELTTLKQRKDIWLRAFFVIFAQNVRGFETSRPSTDTPFSQPFRSDGMRNVIFCDYSWNQECNKTSETSDVSPDVFSLFLLWGGGGLSHICISLCGL